VKDYGPLPAGLACDYIRQAALGLQHAFERDLVHRDLKPSNLLLTRAGPPSTSLNGSSAPPPGQPVVKILDFGLARPQASNDRTRLTQIGNILGTVDYISPEQVENAQKADIRSDIYSLGCTLFYLLCGRSPFSGSSIFERVSGRLQGETPDLSRVAASMPPGLESILQKMLAARPEDRFQTPLELAEALLPFCQPGQAGPWENGKKAAGQNGRRMECQNGDGEKERI